MTGHESSASGVVIASAAMDVQVKLWNSRNGFSVASIKGHSKPVNFLCFSPKSQLLVTGSSDQSVEIWSGRVGKMIRVIKDEENNDSVTVVCYKTVNGELIAEANHSGELRLYRRPSPEQSNGT